MDYAEVYCKVFAEEPRYNSLRLSQEENYLYVMRYIKPRLSGFNSVVDFGSGRGVLLSHLLSVFRADQILSCDLERFHDFPVVFEQIDLTRDLPKLFSGFWDLATCTDVLEHLESTSLEYVLGQMSYLANRFIFTIANHDSFSRTGIQLHLTREPFPFWKELLEKFFRIEESHILKNGLLYGFVLTSKSS